MGGTVGQQALKMDISRHPHISTYLHIRIQENETEMSHQTQTASATIHMALCMTYVQPI